MLPQRVNALSIYLLLSVCKSTHLSDGAFDKSVCLTQVGILLLDSTGLLFSHERTRAKSQQVPTTQRTWDYVWNTEFLTAVTSHCPSCYSLIFRRTVLKLCHCLGFNILLIAINRTPVHRLVLLSFHQRNSDFQEGESCPSQFWLRG